MNHLMIDIEALGGAPRGQVVSIGAVLFNGNNPCIKKDYWVIDHLGCADNNSRVIDKSTVVWWMQQSEEARSVFKEKHVWKLPIALQELSFFIERSSVSAVWANGVDFDLEILQNCYQQFNMSIPWKYSKKCCMRSIRNMQYLSPELKTWSEYKISNLAHNALEDAIMQAEYVYNFMRKLNNTGKQ